MSTTVHDVFNIFQYLIYSLADRLQGTIVFLIYIIIFLLLWVSKTYIVYIIVQSTHSKREFENIQGSMLDLIYNIIFFWPSFPYKAFIVTSNV